MYVIRKNGKIITAYGSQRYEGQEFVSPDNPELQAFLNPVPTEAELALQELQATENTADIARKIEDITAFIVDGTPLPVNAATNKPYAQEWMEERKGLRAKL